MPVWHFNILGFPPARPKLGIGIRVKKRKPLVYAFRISHIGSMRKRLWISLAILLAAVLVLLAYGKQQSNEPVYQGKPLSFWLSGYSAMVEGPELSKIDEAVRHVGSNGIPTMLRMLQAKDSSLRAGLIWIARKQRLVKLKSIDAKDRNFGAAMGLITLDPTIVSNAVPALVEIYNKDFSRFSQAQTCSVLAKLGPLAKRAVPALLRNMSSTNVWVRRDAELALGRILSEPELVVPAMTKALHDPDVYIPANAVVILGDYGPAAKAAIPDLVELLKTQNPVLQDQVKYALYRIDPVAAARAGVTWPQAPRLE